MSINQDTIDRLVDAGRLPSWETFLFDNGDKISVFVYDNEQAYNDLVDEAMSDETS